MAFSSTIEGKSVFGNKRVHWGTYTNTGGSTGGDIDTALGGQVEIVQLQPKGSAVATNAPVVNESFPNSLGSAETIVTDANEVGTWLAIGR
ncbi:hypothetical protein HY469_03525 [Candidatus Roizmanbacteria bacterium]|nr:hypothetical protein [Candidatus Roizmanbacteria bacterium]